MNSAGAESTLTRMTTIEFVLERAVQAPIDQVFARLADIEGHHEDPAVARALDELRYFTSVLTILGTYPADPLRAEQGARR